MAIGELQVLACLRLTGYTKATYNFSTAVKTQATS